MAGPTSALRDLATSLWPRLRPFADGLVLLDRVDSTHAVALRLVDQLDDEDMTVRAAVIVARAQSHGRGRGDNRWASPDGGLYLSWVRSGLEPGGTASLPVVAAAAAARAVAALGLTTVGLKWPNDLVVGPAKMGGILVHARHGTPAWATVSLGLNLTVTPPGHLLDHRPVTSLAEHLPPGDWAPWAAALVADFVAALEGGLASPHRSREEWRRRLVHRIGERMSVRAGSGEVVTGSFAGLTEEGFLRLDVGGTVVVLSTGEVVEGARSLGGRALHG